MQAESPELQVVKTMAKKAVMSAASSLHSDEGPDDEFRPMKISIVTTNRAETRDEGEETLFDKENENEIRMGGDDERETDERETYEDNGREEPADSPSVHTDASKEEDQIKTALSELTTDFKNESATSLEPEGEKPEETDIEITLDSHTNSVALFDTSFLDEEIERNEVDDDDLSVVSKSVVDESSKNVKEAEAMAKEMRRQLEESLAEFSKSPNVSIDAMEMQEPSANVGDVLPASSSSDSVDFYTKDKILEMASHSSDPVESTHRIELSIVGQTLETASVSSLSSAKSVTPLRRPRPAFRRRPSTASWTNTTEEVDTATPKVAKFFRSLPITQQQQKLMENCVIPAVFLVVSVAICRTFFHPSLKVGNNQSTTWALTWTILCIVAVVAPVCALEYMMLSGLLTGTVVQEALTKYPEVKKFLKDVRRMRLKAGWWYTSEVRTLRKDLEATHAYMLLQQEDSSKSRREEDDEDKDARSIQRQMSREDHRREKAQLEKVFGGERSEWYSVKDELMTEALTEKEKRAQLQDQLETEQQKQKQLAEQKVLLENNIEVERSSWDSERKSLKEDVKHAIDEANEVKDTLECQISQLMDANDAKYEIEIKTLKGKFLGQKLNFERILEEAKGEQHVSRQCVQNLQSVLEEERSEWNSEREGLEEKVRTANTERDESIVVRDGASLQHELKAKESKIKAQEESIQQLENIISIQGLMSRHDEWQAANHHVGQLLVASRAVLEASVVASETPELAGNFRNSLKEYTSASASAKKYMDEQTCHVDEIAELPASFVAASATSTVAKVSNPWFKHAPLWEQIRYKTKMWASLATINSTTDLKAAMKIICSGVFVGTGVGLGLLHLRKQQQPFR